MEVSMTTLQLILFLLIFPFFVGVIYAAVARLTGRLLRQRGWQVIDTDEERIGFEPEFIYYLPPDKECFTLWQAYRKQRRLDRNPNKSDR